MPAWVLFIFLFLVGLVIYYPVADYMLIDDGISGLWEVKHMNWQDVLRSDHFKSLYQLHYFFLKAYYYFFGIQPLPYYLLFVGMQALVSTLWFVLGPKILEQSRLANSRLVFLFVAIILMIAPNNFENIAWAATSHYNLAMIFYLFGLLSLYNYFESGNKYLYPFHVLFILSLFTMEMSLLFPISIAIIILLRFASDRDKNAFLAELKWILFPMMVFMAISFGLLKWLNNEWLPHGAASENFVPNIFDTLTHLWLYIVQCVANTQFMANETRMAYYGFVKASLFFPLLIVTLLILFMAVRKKKYNVLFYILHIILFLAPNLFRFGASASSYENVRFVYFALPFVLSLFLFIFNRSFWVLNGVFVLLFFSNFMLLNKTKQDRIISGKLHHNYLAGLQQYGSKNIYLLNIPSFCNEFFVYRSIRRVGIDAEMHYAAFSADDYNEVLWYYAKGEADSFSVSRTDTNTLTVQTQTNGVWLMREHFGATDYETTDYKVRVGEWGRYEIIFKKAIEANARILLYSGGNMLDVTDTLRNGVIVK